MGAKLTNKRFCPAGLLVTQSENDHGVASPALGETTDDCEALPECSGLDLVHKTGRKRNEQARMRNLEKMRS